MRIFSLMAVLLLSQNTWAVVSPTSLKITVYQIAVALSADCSSPQVLFSSAVGQEKDFLASPSLGSGDLADGSYNCVMITMDDVIKFTPAGTEGSCTAATEYAIDLCRTTASSGGEAYMSTTDLLEGTTTSAATQCAGTSQIVGSGGTANKVTLYLRTNALTQIVADAQYVGSWLKGTTLQNSVSGGAGPSVDRANGINLTAPFVVSGSASGIFYVDATNQVTGAGGNCEMNAPEFGFR